MKKKPQDLTALLIAYDETRRKIERIQNDPEYIEQRAREIFKDREPHDYTAEINAILSAF